VLNISVLNISVLNISVLNISVLNITQNKTGKFKPAEVRMQEKCAGQWITV
jgi:hypothetical protein